MAKDHADGVQSGGAIVDLTTHPGELEHGIARARTALSESHRALIGATDEQELLDTICRIAVGVAGYSLAWVGFAEHDERKTAFGRPIVMPRRHDCGRTPWPCTVQRRTGRAALPS